jgi:hypothetical protein
MQGAPRRARLGAGMISNMPQMISITKRRQPLARSWIWDRKRRLDAAERPEEPRVDETTEIKPAIWPPPRAGWLPPVNQ